MKAEIKSHMIIDDFFISPEEYVPNDRFTFNIGFTFDIGITGQDGSNIFNVNISNKCHQKEEIYFYKDISFRYGCIQMEYYDYEKIIKAIKKYIDNINVNNWDDIVNELRKVFKWEFENYSNIKVT